VRPYGELHATNEKHLFDFSDEKPSGYWPVFKGESFVILSADTGRYYGWAEPKKAAAYLQEKRLRASTNPKSPFSEFSPEYIKDAKTNSCFHPRIAFRDITRSTDSRTLRAALIPSNVVCTNKAPYLLFPRGDVLDVAYVLGIMCSLPMDWYARRYVELTMNFWIINSFPLPRPRAGSDLRKRVITIAGRLACPDSRYKKWADAVGVDCGPVSDADKQDMIHELDAVVSHLYELTTCVQIKVCSAPQKGREIASGC
jgi:hypothetical protein